MALLALASISCGSRAVDSSRSGRRELSLLHIADLHSHLFPEEIALGARDRSLQLGDGDTAMAGGAARLATVLDEERLGADVSVTLDAGDLLEGTAGDSLFGGVPEMRVIAPLGVGPEALGNHDLAPGAA